MAPERWLVVGHGSVGAFVAERLAQTGSSVAVLDPAPRLPIVSGTAVTKVESGAYDCVVSCVPPDVAETVPATVAGALAADGLFFDWNTVSPEVKRRIAAAVPAGAVDVALLDSVDAGNGRRPRLAVSGDGSGRGGELLAGAGFDVVDAGPDVGQAAALKYLRSLFMKTLEALVLEFSALAAELDPDGIVRASVTNNLGPGLPRSWTPRLHEPRPCSPAGERARRRGRVIRGSGNAVRSRCGRRRRAAPGRRRLAGERRRRTPPPRSSRAISGVCSGTPDARRRPRQPVRLARRRAQTAARYGADVVRWQGDPELLASADVVAHVTTKVDAALIEAMPACRVIARFGTGLDTVDRDAAERAGIAVVGVRDYCIPELASHTLALAFTLARRIRELDGIEAGWDQVPRPRRSRAGAVRRSSASARSEPPSRRPSRGWASTSSPSRAARTSRSSRRDARLARGGAGVGRARAPPRRAHG